jgi:hypothetical protein
MTDPTTGITAADIEQAKREFERARFEEMQRITAEHAADYIMEKFAEKLVEGHERFIEKHAIKKVRTPDEQRAYDLLERAKARVRRNSEGMGG